MSKSDLQQYTFYFCDLKSGNQNCPKKDTCKRYQIIKDESYNDYKEMSARLYNICSKDNYKLYLKQDYQPPVKESEDKNAANTAD